MAEESWNKGGIVTTRSIVGGAAVSESNPLPVGAGRTKVVAGSAIVVSTTAYAAGDVVGSRITFAGAARAIDKTGLLQQVSVFCKSPQTASLDLLLFHTDPTASTFTDNAALALAVADFDKLVGVVHLGDWTNLGTPSLCQADNLAKPFAPAAGSADLYGVLVTRSVMTLASTSDVKVSAKILQD